MLHVNKKAPAVQRTILNFVSLLILLIITTLQSACTSSKKDDAVVPEQTENSVIPGAPEKFKNPEGYMTVEVNGKVLEFGVSIATSQLWSVGTGGIYGYTFYASAEIPNAGVKSITINISTDGEFTNISTLKGIHKSSTTIGDYGNTVRVKYTESSAEKRLEQNWINDKDCIVEITSTTSPWIEGTFTVDDVLSGPTPLTIKKGTFKIRYAK